METSREIRVNTATTCPGAAARANYRFCVFIIMSELKMQAYSRGWIDSVCGHPCALTNAHKLAFQRAT